MSEALTKECDALWSVVRIHERMRARDVAILEKLLAGKPVELDEVRQAYDPIPGKDAPPDRWAQELEGALRELRRRMLDRHERTSKTRYLVAYIDHILSERPPSAPAASEKEGAP